MVTYDSCFLFSQVRWRHIASAYPLCPGLLRIHCNGKKTCLWNEKSHDPANKRCFKFS